MSLFPAMLKLEGRKCVVAGAGRVASAKVVGLLDHRAHVIVVSPQAVSRIRTLERERRLVWRRRVFSARDLAGACLVVAATDSPQVNESVFRACRARGILCNVVDDPEHCDFFYPAVVRRGSLQIAISTGGRSPALAAQLRRELEKQFRPEWSAWVEHVGRTRRRLLSTAMPPDERRERLLRSVSPRAFLTFLRKVGDNTAKRPTAAGKKWGKKNSKRRR